MAGGRAGAVLAPDGGSRIELTKDCTTWQAVTVPGPAATQVRAVARFGSGYIAVGQSGSGTGSEPMAWWSTDGRTWSSATVPRKSGIGFDRVEVGRLGLVATSQGEGIPGIRSLWWSHDGHSWAISREDPFGAVAQGEGVGSAAGAFTGDGNRLLAFGTPGQAAGPVEYWLSSDGKGWLRLALTGTTPDSSASYFRVFLMRDGVLFSGASGTWFGDPVAE
ncbi:MAG: hypothetical protein ACYDCI_12110 [Candidatus Limnocylindrales bacterium]